MYEEPMDMHMGGGIACGSWGGMGGGVKGEQGGQL